MWFCSIFGEFLRKKWFVVFRNFGVILMRFEVFLSYSVQCLYVYLCSFVVFIPPLHPPCSIIFCRMHILIFHTVNVWHQNNKWRNKLLCLFAGERLPSITVFILYSLDQIHISLLCNTRADQEVLTPRKVLGSPSNKRFFIILW